jgi:hypothetical protein
VASHSPSGRTKTTNVECTSLPNTIQPLAVWLSAFGSARTDAQTRTSHADGGAKQETRLLPGQGRWHGSAQWDEV